MSRHKHPRRTNIPDHELEALARCLLPDIQAYFESEEGKQAFAAWQKQQQRKEQKKRQ